MTSVRSILEINLRDLRRRCVNGDPLTREAVRVLDAPPKGAAEINLEWLLRHHRQRAVETRRELDLREGVDRLLAFYGSVEIACLCGYAPAPLPDEFAASAISHLTNWHVRRFYEEHYPLLLPQLLRLRISNALVKSTDAADGSRRRAFFVSFLDLNDSIEDDEDVAVFLKLLDDMSWGGTGLRDLESIVADPKRFGECLARESGNRTLDAGANGLRQYLIFCVGLHELLVRAAGDPIVASAFWHYHGYWFGRLDVKFGKRLSGFVGQFRAWPGMADGTLSRVESAVLALIDKRHEAALGQYVRSHGGSWPA